eukprot:scaffold99841_cov54-Phaeocystis_antarctica.AAC.2
MVTSAESQGNTEFPNFPDWANPTALITLCNNLNTLHAADPTTNPATCLGFHSGPWVSVFGLNIDQPTTTTITTTTSTSTTSTTMYAPHLPEGTDWITWDEGSGTIDITGTKPNHQYVCYIKGNVCPGGIDPAPEGTAACQTRTAHRTSALPQHLAGLAQPDYAKLRAAVSAGPVPMPSRLFISDAQATTAATTARASTLWLSMATTRAACTMRASAVQWSSTTPQRR